MERLDTKAGVLAALIVNGVSFASPQGGDVAVYVSQPAPRHLPHPGFSVERTSALEGGLQAAVDAGPPTLAPFGEATASALMHHEMGHVSLELGGSGCNTPGGNQSRLSVLPGGGDRLPVPKVMEQSGGTLYGNDLELRTIHGSLLYASTGWLHVHFRERIPSSQDWVLTTQEFGIGYRPLMSVQRDSHDHYVLGFADRSQSWIIERISIGQTPGSYGLIRPIADEETGTPYISPETDPSIIGNQGFVHPDQRSWVSAPREILWIGNLADIGAPSDFSVDPDGRFFVIVDREKDRIIRIDPDAEESLSVLQDGASVGGVSGVMYLQFHDSDPHGRVLSAHFPESCPHDHLVFRDHANDGLFELTESMGATAFGSTSFRGSFTRDFWDFRD